MPELPEIDHLRRTLEPVLVGAVVREVRLVRRDIVRNRPLGRRVTRRDLLLGQAIETLQRRGKELAIVSRSGLTVLVHLGMSGQLRHCPAGRRLPRFDHVHCIWALESRRGRARVFFRDPRRFGGLRIYPSRESLVAQRWSLLGPDALKIAGRTLSARLERTRRPIKAALLDQHLVAGIGNIYADEILFAAGIDPRARADRIGPSACLEVAAATRHILARAIEAGGSTIRDYADADGRSGGYVARHLVYGRGSQPCVACGTRLRLVRLAQRSTVFCPKCQSRRPVGSLGLPRT